MHHFVAIGEFKLEVQSGNAQFGSKSTIFRAVWPWNLTYDLEQGKSIVTGLVILLKLDLNRRFFSPRDLDIWWMTQKTIGHLFYATLSFLHHFVAIGEYKLELQSGNA